MEEISLGSNLQEPRPILISSRLSEKEKLELIMLLKEFKYVFTWDYSEMLGLDPGLVVHTLNVDPEAKPVAQLAKIFHFEIEGQIVKEVQKLLAAEFIKPAPALVVEHSASKEEERADKVLHKFQKS